MSHKNEVKLKASHTLLVASAGVFCGALCLSSSAVLVKLAGVDAMTTAMLRCAIAVLVLIPLAVVEHARRGGLSLSGIGWAITAGVALGIDYAAWTVAIYQIGAGISTVLINVQVIVLPLLALIIDRERVTMRFLLTVPLMLFGISLVSDIWNATEFNGPTLTGTMLGLLAGIGYGTYLFLTRRAARQEPGRMIQPLAWATASASMTIIVITQFVSEFHLADISAHSWTLLAILAIIGQVLAWLLIHHGGIRLHPTTTATILLAQPVLALGLAAFALAEYPTPIQLAGAGIVVVAVAISNGRVKRLPLPSAKNGPGP